MSGARAGRAGRAARASRARRSRGYAWEDALSKRISAEAGWAAVRLGSPSAGLPDVLAVSSEEDSVIVIEAKSGTSASIRVPADQIERCVRWTRMLDRYGRRAAVLAFKFSSKRRTGGGAYERRQLREYYKEWDPSEAPAECSCTYDGRTYLRDGAGRREAPLADYRMPFGARGRARRRRRLFRGAARGRGVEGGDGRRLVDELLRSGGGEFDGFVDERAMTSRDALGGKEMKIKVLEVSDEEPPSRWKLGDRVKVDRILVTIKHSGTQQVEEAEFDIKAIEEELSRKRHYTSTNRWVPAADIRNGYVAGSRHTSLISDAVALDYISF